MNELNALIKFAANLHFGEIPELVREKAKLCLLDFIANIFAGACLEEGRQIAHFTKNLKSRPEATVIGFGFKASCRQSALANGTLGALLQSHDGFKLGGNHPSSAVIPACLSLSEHLNRNGKDLLTAVVVGYEVANRIAASIHPSHSLKGFAPTGTAGSFGAAIAACKLLDLPVEKCVQALGIAGFILPICTYETLLGKYSITPIHGGMAAQTGLMAAHMADAGYKGCPDILRGSFGRGFSQITCDNPDLTKLDRGLGAHFTIMDVYLKAYPACRHTHAALDAVLEVKDRYRFVWQDIERIQIKTYKMAMQFVQYTNPGDELYPCQMSLPYTIAVALMDGHIGVDQYTEARRKDPLVHDFSRKIETEEDPELTKLYPICTPAVVEIELKNGTKLSGRCELPKGDPDNPLPSEELLSKVTEFCSLTLSAAKYKRLISQLDKIEMIVDWGEFISWLHEDFHQQRNV